MSDKPLTDVAFANFDLHPALAAGLASAGFTRCTPIQALTLPLTLQGRDIAGQAQTGTGKTVAFLVAIMDRLLKRTATANRRQADPRAVILAPTRELAIQIAKDAEAIAGDSDLKIALVYGGVDYDKQRRTIEEGCDMLIGTPGRMLDYYRQKVFSFAAVEVIVLDEADRMFDLGFIKDIRYIMRRLPPRDERQNLLYSATLSNRVLELAYEHMNDPEKLTVETESITAARVRQTLYFPSTEEKPALLLNLLAKTDPTRTMVFVNTKHVAERVARTLDRHGHRVGLLSGDVPQKKRQKLLGDFKEGRIDMLVATDVAARGLHIEAVSHVFNYDLPQDAQDYVHRIGRTARLGAEGDAISFACDKFAMSLPEIEAFIEQKIPVEALDPGLLVPPRPPRRAEGDSDSDRESRIDTSAADPARGSAHGRGRPSGGARRPARSRT